MERVKVLNLILKPITFKKSIELVLAQKGKPAQFFCFANAHQAVESVLNPDLKEAQNEDGIVVLPDGFPIAKSVRLLYGINQERIAGMDFLPAILEECNKRFFKVFLFGSTEEILQRATERINKELPNINVSSVSPPFQKGLPDPKYVDVINKSDPDIVVVALGCPKQEIWMSQNYKKINAPLLGLGGALPVYAGVLSRAPEFIRNIGFEWLYRLFQEPGRLWKRYLVTNTLFIYYISRQWFRMKILGKPH